MTERSTNSIPQSIPGSDAEGLTIPFNRPSLEGHEMEYMRQAVEQGHTSADGPFSKQAAEILREAGGAEEVLL
ncbi:MAG: hypothetical protein HKN26_14135, partial [Acidimicrobiales bacterium]|nr:hypothetical protein [Acidimicrobiales bacterium]